MYDVVSLGDALIDFTPLNDDSTEKITYEVNVGGTIANFSACCSKLGLRSLIVSRVGADIFGEHIEKTLKSYNVDTKAMQFDPDHFTTLAFVNLLNGERSFSFARKNNADIFLDLEKINVEDILATKVLHFSGMSFSDEPVRSTARFILKEAAKRSIFITLDINYREALWESESEYIEVILKALPYMKLVKGSLEEISILTGESDHVKSAEKIKKLGAELIIISGGEKGAFFYRDANTQGVVNTYDTVRIDTTGAGDSFTAALVYSLLNKIDREEHLYTNIEKNIDFANAAGAVSITKKGGSASAPSIQDILECKANMPILEKKW